ncbi:MAG: HepT-like ribonuclease domain-containing protein [Thermofilaceae archaeon]
MEVFEELGRRRVVSRDVSEGFRRLIGLRNILVHRCLSVDDARIYKGAKEGGLNVVEEVCR